MLLNTPHLQCIRETARGRIWHSVLFSGYFNACRVLMRSHWYAEGVRVRGMHTFVVGERTAWAALSILCRNPLWLLVASCCPATSQWKRPMSGRPMRLLIAFLGGEGWESDLAWMSLRMGCRVKDCA